MAALIRFPAVDIQLDGLEIDLELPTRWLDSALAEAEVQPREEGGHITGRLSRSGSDIVVRAKVKAAVQQPCARCLEPAEFDVRTELSLLLQPMSRSELRSHHERRRTGSGSASNDDEYEFTDAEAALDVYDGENVILDAFVREAILLEVPTFPLCRDSCPGLQAAAPLAEIEQARAFDPRLAPLDAFRDKDKGPITVEDLVAAAAERSSAIRGRKPVLKAHHGGQLKKRKKKK
jgi:uncharacterized protein